MGARELLADLSSAGISITASGQSLIVRPASKLTKPMRDALNEAKPELMALLRQSPGWTDADISRFTKRRDRLMRWGWAEPDAEKLAERLVQRDREEDDRVSCTDCQHYRPGRCGNHRRAGLGTHDLGRDLASLLQRCEGFKP
jgi:TubC N-terminal docking domain